MQLWFVVILPADGGAGLGHGSTQGEVVRIALSEMEAELACRPRRRMVARAAALPAEIPFWLRKT